MARPSAYQPKAIMAALLVLAVASMVQARLPLRQLLQSVPPTWTPKSAMPLPVFQQKPFSLTQPIYGPCSAVSSATGKAMSGGGYSGTMQCAGIDTVYYVGDEPGTDGRQMACFSSGGSRCGPDQPGCECVYPPPTNKEKWMCWSTGNWWWPTSCGWRPTYVAWEGGGPGAGMCLVCPPRPRPATLNNPVVGPCASVYKGNFQGTNPPLTTGTSLTAPVACAGFPGVFYVGDNSDNGNSWACYNNAGMPCAPGDGSCPCQYLNGSATASTPAGTGAGQCVICPPLPTVANDQPLPLNPCNNALGCGPQAPGVFYGACDNTNFKMTPAGDFSRLALYGTPASGPVACVGQPGVYYTSAIPNTNNGRLACFNYQGIACAPGSPGCPCDYLQTYDPAGTQFASASQIQGAYQCLVCPPVTSVPVVNAPAPPPPPPIVQAVEYGTCSQVFGNLFNNMPAPFTPGGWTGRVTCTTDPLRASYWVGDATDAGASLACFDSYGGKCKANTTGCPCQYLSVYKSSSGAVTYAANNANNGGGKCVVCPPAPVPVTLPNPPPGVIYQPCASSNFALGGVANTPLPTSGSWTGLAYCASVPNSPGYWVGDGNDAGKSVACYNYLGKKCAPGSAGCPCVYGTPNSNGLYASNGNTNGAGMCLVCPPMPRAAPPPPQAKLPPAPQAPATSNPPRPPPPYPPPPSPNPPKPPAPLPSCVDTDGPTCTTMVPSAAYCQGPYGNCDYSACYNSVNLAQSDVKRRWEKCQNQCCKVTGSCGGTCNVV